MSASVIDCKGIAAAIRGEVSQGVSVMRDEHGIVPGLAVVLVGDDPASSVYVRNKHKAATEVGMLVEVVKLTADATQNEVVSNVDRISNNDTIHGMIVQLPLPKHIDSHSVIEAVSPLKDVDGLHPFNMGLLAVGRQRFVPATPAGIQEILLRSGVNVEGAHVVICGRSNIVGKPLASLLVQRRNGANATVTVCHTRTYQLPLLTKQADILVAAVGRPGMVKADMVKEGCIVVDVGVNRVEAPDRRSGYRLVGDVDFDSVSERAGAITPVPGGVGPMTIAMLLKQTLKAAQIACGIKLEELCQL